MTLKLESLPLVQDHTNSLKRLLLNKASQAGLNLRLKPKLLGDLIFKAKEVEVADLALLEAKKTKIISLIEPLHHLEI